MGPGLGQLSLVCPVVANMIGVGVFTTLGFALADLGSPRRVMLAWLAGGLIAFTGALSYAGLARRVTESDLFLRLIKPSAARPEPGSQPAAGMGTPVAEK